MPDHYPVKMKVRLTEERVQRYAAASGDTNPIHLKKEAAKQAGFPERLAHGMLTMAVSTKLITPLMADGWHLERLTGQFLAPVFINDNLVLTADVQAYSIKQQKLKIIGENQYGKKVFQGNAVLLKQKETFTVE